MTRKDTATESVSASKIRIPKAAEIVSRDLRNQIVRGLLKEGDSLPAEADMMLRFGVSRPTLREAIRILESEGLITIARGARGGAVVHSPDVNVAARHISFVLQANRTTLSDIYRVHMLVEPAAARMVAVKFQARAPSLLSRCIEEGRQSLDDDFAFGIATARFRNLLIELAGAATLTLLMGMLSHIFEVYWGTVTVAAGKHLNNTPDKRRGLRSMEKLVEFIAAGNANAAEAHWRQHMQAVEKTMRKWLPTATVIDILDA
jgi:GntR family transcriptional regulator, transcriptional repressor for pyruvate dehydrogenase complex